MCLQSAAPEVGQGQVAKGSEEKGPQAEEGQQVALNIICSLRDTCVVASVIVVVVRCFKFGVLHAMTDM